MWITPPVTTAASATPQQNGSPEADRKQQPDRAGHEGHRHDQQRNADAEPPQQPRGDQKLRDQREQPRVDIERAIERGELVWAHSGDACSFDLEPVDWSLVVLSCCVVEFVGSEAQVACPVTDEAVTGRDGGDPRP